MGGLVVSQLLTLYTTPVVYLYIDRARLWFMRTSVRLESPPRPTTRNGADLMLMANDPMEIASQRRPDRNRAAALLACCAAGLLAGCAVGPTSSGRRWPCPPRSRRMRGWTSAAPGDGSDRGPWWEVFGDPVLNELETRLGTSNESIVQAAANYEEAMEIARSDRTSFLPFVSVAGSANRSRSTDASSSTGHGATTSNFNAQLQASWQPDFWGKIRRTVEADVAGAQASAADLASARLSSQGALAQDYVDLRAADEKIRLLEDAVAAYARTVKITQNKYSVGVSARSDVITAQTQLDSARAQLIDEALCGPSSSTR